MPSRASIARDRFPQTARFRFRIFPLQCPTLAPLPFEFLVSYVSCANLRASLHFGACLRRFCTPSKLTQSVTFVNFRAGAKPKIKCVYKSRDHKNCPGKNEAGLVWFLGKQIELGGDTHYRRLFDLLRSNIGCPISIASCMRHLDGFETSKTLEHTAVEVKKAKQRFRTALKRLRERIKVAGLDHDIGIVRHKVLSKTQANQLILSPSLSMEFTAGSCNCATRAA